MVCTQCGHDNPVTAKFCNQCGSLVDRRKGERRRGDRRKTHPQLVAQEGVASRRPSPLPSLTPGQENAQGHSPARETAEAFLRKERPFRGPEQMAVEDARESGAPAGPIPMRSQRYSAPVSGPSFLGLAEGSSGSAEYLLEEESHNSWRKWAVLLLLVLIGVLVYMQWRTNFRAQPASPPSQSQPTQPQGSATPASEATGVLPQQASAAAQPAPSPPTDKDPAAAAQPPKPEEPASADQASDKDKATDKKDAAAEDKSNGSEEEAPAEPERRPRAPFAGVRKPAAGRSTASDIQPDPMLLMARKYLYGQGVRMDCDQAMVYLRAANQKASAPARSQMGALYATGHCVPLDRVRAYQWFTSALNVEPANSDLQRERNNLWARMSSDERQQAVK